MQVYLIRRKDTGRHVGYAPDHVHVWDDQTRAMFYVWQHEHDSGTALADYAIEEYTLRPTWLQVVRWFLAWVTT